MQTLQTRQWYQDDYNINQNQFSYVEMVKQNFHARHSTDLRHLRLYGVSALFGGQIDPLAIIDDSKIRMGLNIVKSCVDTAYNKIARQYIKPMFLTDGADWLMKQRAEKLGKFVEGVFYETDFNEKASEVFRSGGIFGSGLILWDNPKACEVVMQSDCIIDEVEGKYGKVYQLHVRKFVSKEFLIEKYPKKKSIIIGTQFETDDNIAGIYPDSTVCWLRSYVLEGGKVKLVSSTRNGLLEQKEMDMDYIPYCKFDFDKAVFGFWGRGLAEQLAPIQLEINKTLRTISLCMHLGAVPKVFVEANSKIIKAQLNNEIGSIITFFGQRPTSEQLMKVPPELWAYLDNLYNKAYEITGLTQMMANGEKPAGLDSGKALRTFHDIESIRHAKLAQAWEKFCIDNAKMVIKLSKTYAKQVKDFQVSILDDKKKQVLKWSEVDMSEDCYAIRAYPTSFLSELPSQRFADIQELLSAQLIDTRQAKVLLDYPDIKQIETLDNAPTENILAVLAYIVEEGKYYPPEPLQDLDYGISIFSNAYLKYALEGLPDDRVSLLIQWINDAKALQQQIGFEDQQSQQINAQAQQAQVPVDMNQVGPDSQQGV